MSRASLLLLALLAGLPACGDPPARGSGSLTDGPFPVLRLAGSPEEMGWWHGHLLKDRIRATHDALERATIEACVGSAPDLDKGAAGKLRYFLSEFASQTRGRLPESFIQELRGMARGSGLPEESLLRLALLRDALRVTVGTLDARLPGALAVVGDAERQTLRALWRGPDAEVLAGRWMLIQRTPLHGPATVVLGWPGALGGIAGIADTRMAYALADATVDVDLRGFHRGVPLALSCRHGLDTATTLLDFQAAAGGGAGHVVVALADTPDKDPMDAARGFVALYRGSQPWIDLDDRPWIVMGPFQRSETGLAKTQLLQVPDDPATHPSADEIFRRAADLAPPGTAGRASPSPRTQDPSRCASTSLTSSE